MKHKASSLSPRCGLCGGADWVFYMHIDLDDSFIDKYRCRTCGEIMKITTMRKKEVAEGGRLKELNEALNAVRKILVDANVELAVGRIKGKAHLILIDRGTGERYDLVGDDANGNET